MDIRVKICGITNLMDARVAVDAGADFLGFILYSPSPRSVTVPVAREIIDAIHAEYQKAAPIMVGVFVNESLSALDAKMYHSRLDVAQLSGDESAEVMKGIRYPAYKAIQPRSIKEAEMDIPYFVPHASPVETLPSILVDAYHPDLRGGTGHQADPTIVKKIISMEPRTMLAGGLTAENIAGVVQTLRPFAVDVASGVESAQKGMKDHDKVRNFIFTARNAAAEVT